MARNAERGWLRNLQDHNRPGHPRRPRRLSLEPLEDRAVPAIIVNSSLHGTDTSSSTTTLVEALQQADALGGSSTITFNSTLTGTTLLVDDSKFLDNTVDTGRTFYPKITANITIQGPITLDGTGKNARFFDVAPGGSLTLDQVNLTGGTAHGGNGGNGSGGGGGGGAGLGGAVFVDGATASLTINQSSLAFNNAIGGDGGSGFIGSFSGGGGGLGGDGSASTPGGGGGGGGPRTSAVATQTGADGVGGTGGPLNGAGTDATGRGAGGGGGGNETLNNDSTGGGHGGNGSFGGGGGGAGTYSNAGSGGFGGGGGATANPALGSTGGGGAFGGWGGTWIGIGSWEPIGGGGAGLGGAIFNLQGTVTLNNVTLTDNTAQGGGGANPGAGGGGALFNYDGTVSLKDSTIAFNNALSPQDFNHYGLMAGGGIYNYSAGGTPAVTLTNSIVAGSNVGAPRPAEDVNVAGGTVTVLGSHENFIGTATGTITGTYLTGNPLLSLPGKFGGLILAPPEPGSPLVAAATSVQGTDERGVSRPSLATLGAYEGALPSPLPLKSGDVVLADSSLGALFAVDPSTHDRRLVSMAGVVGNGPGFSSPQSLVVDGSGNIYVLDTGLNAVVRVDGQTGNRTIVSSSSVGSGPLWIDPTAITREANGTLVVSDPGNLDGTSEALFAVDPTTGNRTILSDETSHPNATNAFYDPVAVLVTDTGGIVVADDFFGPNAPYDSALLGVNPASGARTILSNDNQPNSNNPIVVAGGIAEDSDHNLLVIDQNTGARRLLKVSSSSGERTIVATFGSNPVEGVAVDPSSGTVYVTRTGSTPALNQVLTVSGGNPQVFAGNSVASGPFFGTGLGMGLAVAEITPEQPPSAPVDSNGAANSVAEGAAAGTTVGITASSSDPDGQSVSYSITSDSSGGGFQIDSGSGVVTVKDGSKIDYESSGSGHTYSITVQASDGTLTSSSSFTISVSDVAPSVPTDSNSATNRVPEGATAGTTVGVTAHSSDPSGGTVAYSLTSDGSGGGFQIDSSSGVVTVKDGSKISFASAPNHAYSITVAASDGTLTSSQTFSITVIGTPTANAQSATTMLETAVGVTLAGSDPNSPALPLTYTVSTGPAHGQLSGTAPNLTYTPSAGYEGPDSFQFTVNNGSLTSAPATVSITVNPGYATSLSISGPTAVTGGSASSYTITALDKIGHTATAYSSSVTLGTTDPNVSGPGPVTMAAGVGTASVTFRTGGTWSLSASGPNPQGGANVTGSLGNIQVNLALTTTGGVVIDDGSSQRSMVRKVTLTFQGLVSPTVAPFSLTSALGATISLVLGPGSVTTVNGNTQAVFTFSGTSVDPKTGTLSDGRYTFREQGQVLATFFRLFGDSNGDGKVDVVDSAAFMAAYRSVAGQANYRSYFDYGGYGAINAIDYYWFQRYSGMMLDASGNVVPIA